FKTCPLLYRFRTIDRLAEPADAVMVRGSLVHAVLEDLFGEPAPGRTLEKAVELLPAEWAKLRDAEPRLAELFSPEQAAEEATWLASCVDLLGTYFRMEDPRWLEPASREERVSYEVEPGLSFAGIVDRLDIAPDGRIRVVDYKSGRSPDPRYEDRAMFQMKFYALVIWRTRGVMPTLLQLMYLGDGSFLTYTPDERDLLATERKLVALWAAIERAIELRDFPPRKSGLCGWCAHKSLCPEWGGTAPDLPLLQLVTDPRPTP
ncbi:MAG: recombinase RecB, partial [Aeromicrobium sp.]|nr:recombinase RecB [Aeromicrobium sp.]